MHSFDPSFRNWLIHQPVAKRGARGGKVWGRTSRRHQVSRPHTTPLGLTRCGLGSLSFYERGCPALRNETHNTRGQSRKGAKLISKVSNPCAFVQWADIFWCGSRAEAAADAMAVLGGPALAPFAAPAINKADAMAVLGARAPLTAPTAPAINKKHKGNCTHLVLRYIA